MSLQTGLYLLPYLLSVLLCAGVGLYALSRRSVPGAVPFAWTALLPAISTVAYILELISSSLGAKIFWDDVQFWLLAAAPLVLLAFACQYTGRRPARPWRTFGLLAAPLVLFLLLLATDHVHGLVRPEAWLVPGRPFSELRYDFTPAVQIFFLYGFGLVIAAFGLLLAFFLRSPRLYRIQTGIIILGTLFPLLGTVLTLAGVSLGFHRDTAPFTTAIRSLVVGWALFRYHLLDVVPVAWNTVIENMTDAVIVIDAQFRIVDLNPAARQLSGSKASQITGRPVARALAGWPDLAELCRAGTTRQREVVLQDAGGTRHFDLSCVPLRTWHDQVSGHVLVLRDTTERAQAQEALRRAYDELEARVEARTEEAVHLVDELRILNSLNHRVSASLSPEQVIETALLAIADSVKPDLALIYLRQGRELRLGGLHAPGLGFEHDTPQVKHVGECLCGLAVSKGQPLYSSDIHDDARCTLDECKEAGLRSFAALPLIRGDEVLGVLGLASAAERDFGPRAGFLEALAGEVALGLQNALLHTRLERYTAGLEETVAQRTRELQAERDRTGAILETLGDSVIVTDTEGLILYMNPATTALTGYPRDKIVGQRAWLWVQQRQDAEGEPWRSIRQALLAGRIWRGEVACRHREGTAYDAAVTVAPLFDPDDLDQLIGSVWVQRDVTPIKEAERVKDQFISNVSHELRTPLSIITLTGDNLGTYYQRLDDDARRSMIQSIREQALVLNDLIGDVLEISRIDSGRISVERGVVNLARRAREEVEKQRPLAERRYQVLTTAGPESLPVWANDGQVGQIIRNLLNNAIKYTPEGGHIACTCRAEDGPLPGVGAGPWAVLQVRDDGTGIEPEHLPHIFERFYRAHVQSSIPGTGLGLPIARELVELQGGHVTVSSNPGEGSLFSVYLPLGEEGRS